jgi:hypothetical protein
MAGIEVCRMTEMLEEDVKEGLPVNVHVLRQTPQLKAMMTMIRNQNTLRGDFVFYSDRIIRLLVEEGSRK